MAKYYYRKYEGVINYSRANEKAGGRNSWIYVKAPVYRLGNTTISAENGSRYLKCDTLTGYYIEGLTEQAADDWMYVLTYYMMIASPSNVRVFQGNGYRLADSWRDNGGHMEYEFVIEPHYVPGAFLGEVLAADGAFPDDGYDAGSGFYYVKDRVAVEFYVRADGVQRAAGTYVRSGGIWRAANPHPRIGGAWIG